MLGDPTLIEYLFRPQPSNIVKRKQPKGSDIRQQLEQRKLDLLEREVKAKEEFMNEIRALEREKVELLRELVRSRKE